MHSYVDGVLVDQTAYLVNGSIDTYALPFTNHQGLTTSQTNWAVNIGQDGTGVYDDNTSAHNIGAKLDDLGIWRRALSAEEAQAVYAAGRAGNDLSQAVTKLSLTLSGSKVVLEWPGKSTVKLPNHPGLESGPLAGRAQHARDQFSHRAVHRGRGLFPCLAIATTGLAEMTTWG